MGHKKDNPRISRSDRSPLRWPICVTEHTRARAFRTHHSPSMAACTGYGAIASRIPCARTSWRSSEVPNVDVRAVPSRRLATQCLCAASSLPDTHRVVITGAGVVSTAGNDRGAFFDSLLGGASGVIDLTQWKPGVFDDLPTRIGAPILHLDHGDDLTAKEARRMDRVHQYAVVAGKRALRDAGLWVRGRRMTWMSKSFPMTLSPVAYPLGVLGCGVYYRVDSLGFKV